MLVAVGIVWGVVRNVIVESGDEVSLGKFTLNLEINNVRITEEGVEVSVTRNSGAGELVGISFAISDGVNTQVFDRETTMIQLDTEVFSFDVIDFTDIAFAKEVIAVPILGEGGNEIRGELKGNMEFAHSKLIYDVVSVNNCATLGFGGYPGGDAECGESNFPICTVAECGDASTSASQEDCYDANTLVEAKTICEFVGARLCTRDELLAGASSSTGCGHDAHMIWSSTECGSEGFYIVYGNPSGSGNDEYCVEDVSETSVDVALVSASQPEIGVRCCGDDPAP